MQCDMIDRFTFVSLLDNVAEWKCSCIDGVKFLKVLSLRVHRIRGSHGISAFEIMYVLHNMYVFDRGSLCQKNRRRRLIQGFVSLHIKCKERC